MEQKVEWLLLSVMVVYVIIMILSAYSRFVKKKLVPGEDSVNKSFLQNLIVHKFFLDELYDALFMKPLFRLSGFFDRVIESKMIDRIVNEIGYVAQWTGNAVRYIQTGHVRFYLFVMVASIIAILVFNILIF